jgi:Domain of unknown function (DUF4160)
MVTGRLATLRLIRGRCGRRAPLSGRDGEPVALRAGGEPTQHPTALEIDLGDLVMPRFGGVEPSAVGGEEDGDLGSCTSATIALQAHMPRLMRFSSSEIAMFFADHNPPHFHVLGREGAAQVLIDTPEVIASSGRIDLAEALAWAAENRALLEEKWAGYSGDGQ